MGVENTGVDYRYLGAFSKEPGLVCLPNPRELVDIILGGLGIVTERCDADERLGVVKMDSACLVGTCKCRKRIRALNNGFDLDAFVDVEVERFQHPDTWSVREFCRELLGSDALVEVSACILGRITGVRSQTSAHSTRNLPSAYVGVLLRTVSFALPSLRSRARTPPVRKINRRAAKRIIIFSHPFVAELSPLATRKYRSDQCYLLPGSELPVLRA